MKKLLLIIVLLVQTHLIGDWGFWGDNRSYIGISFNGSQTWYYLTQGSHISGLGAYNNANLGEFTLNSQTLAIAGWDIKTYQNGGSGVSSVRLYYRLYKQAGVQPGFTQVNADQLEDLGSGNLKWGKLVSQTSSIDISGLEANSTYVLEVYIDALGTSPNETKYESNSGSNFKATFTTTSTFPVELSSFSAALSGKSVVLNWRTETEVNNYGFDVERSSDKNSWSTVGFVHGNGNSNSPKQYSFADNSVSGAGKYYYRLKQMDNDGTTEYSKVLEIAFDQPMEYTLGQNYPNPFNPTTAITFSVPEAGFVNLSVFDLLGQKVAELVNGNINAGTYTMDFDATNLQSGIYFYTMKAGSFTETRKMMLTK